MIFEGVECRVRQVLGPERGCPPGAFPVGPRDLTRPGHIGNNAMLYSFRNDVRGKRMPPRATVRWC